MWYDFNWKLIKDVYLLSDPDRTWDLTVSFIVDNQKSGWICEDFFPVTAELLIFTAVIVPCITFLVVMDFILMCAVIPSIYLKIAVFQGYCCTFQHSTRDLQTDQVTIMLEFSGTHREVYIFVLESTCLCFPLHLTLLIEAIDLTAKSRLDSSCNSQCTVRLSSTGSLCTIAIAVTVVIAMLL